ncbi:RRQRL motif-containing zinc-binding protein [Actinokineospora sp. NBRC 105648]|uniref:RRQRL motif-containing zinc-binding protein n=1 Tax=Actinokineospora sp. NBRC 105648 TaxID=3032206 RepID=UPI0024A48FAC|nr:RRQRL motif-containing zinc-binding protein [Actinokineospora sp. NBRC 105648]GLZ43519.1 hypothetical protein Acsp05_71430 [Actinokineospora sp. NBRC 105648]
MAARTRSRRALVDVALPDGRVVTADGIDARHGLPVFWWGSAPAGLLTKRQLAEQGLRPGGADPVACLEWRRGRRWGRLYDVNQAAEKRPMTPAKWRSLAAANDARRLCEICGGTKEYTHSGLCSACYEIAGPVNPGNNGLVAA